MEHDKVKVIRKSALGAIVMPISMLLASHLSTTLELTPFILGGAILIILGLQWKPVTPGTILSGLQGIIVAAAISKLTPDEMRLILLTLCVIEVSITLLIFTITAKRKP